MEPTGLQQLFEELKAAAVKADLALGDVVASAGRRGAAPSPVDEPAAPRGPGAAAQAADYVRAHPWTALGLAAAAGLLVGLWARRK